MALASCNAKKTAPASETRSSPVKSVTSAPTAPSSRHALQARPSQPPRPMRIPVGPRFPIEPGVGIGPIRFGATVETVERQMQAKCDQTTDQVCRYVEQAVEFQLVDHQVVSMTVHRAFRPSGVDKAGLPPTYGIFNGAIPPDPTANRKELVTFGHHRKTTTDALGAPIRTEKVTTPNPHGTVELHYYDGMVLEFDEFEGTNQPVLGGIRIVKRG